MKTTLFLLLVCTVGNRVSAAAFQQINNIGAHTGASKTTPASRSTNVVIGDWRGKQQSSREKQTTTSLAMIDPTSIGATIVALASAAAAWQEYRTDKFQAFREVTGRPLLFEDDKDTKVIVKEEKTTESTPPPKKSFVSRINPLKAKTESAPAPAKVEPVNVSKSATAAPVPAPKPLALEVGNTVEKNREMNELGEKRRKEDEEKKAAVAEKEKKEVALSKAVLASTTSTKKKGGFLRTTWRVINKIIAPWRKWENIG